MGRSFYLLSPLVSPRASGAYRGTALPLTLHCYLGRFVVPRAGFCFLRLFAPAMCSPLRRLRGGFGALPALCHKSEPSAGNARLPPSGCIRSFTLAAPAINQSGRGSYAVVSALLYSRLTRPESSVSMRAAICGAAAAALLARFYIRALHARKAAFPCAQRYAARQQRRFSTRGGMRRGRTVPDYAFRIPHFLPPPSHSALFTSRRTYPGTPPCARACRRQYRPYHQSGGYAIYL